MKLLRTCYSTLILVALTSTAARIVADDWPQWRGPGRDGVWSETGIVDRFDGKQLKPLWRADIANGYSGPTVANGRVYVTDRLVNESNGDTPAEQYERVHCFDAATGKPLWTHQYECPYSEISYSDGPRASVTVDKGQAFALGAMGHLFALDAASGRVQWGKELGPLYKIRMPIWGIAASPLVFDDLVIVQIGGSDGACLVAFDRRSGEERWRALDDRASYAAPILIDQAGHKVLVCWTGDSVAGLDPATGKIHWRHPFKPSRMVLAISTPVAEKNRLFVTGFYDGSLMLQLNPDKLEVSELWRRKGRDERSTDALHSIIATPYLEGDYVYGVDSYGELRCLDAKSGDRIWEDKTATSPARWSNIHMVRNGQQMWMFNERGELLIARLSPKGFEEISRAQLIEPTRGQLNQRGGVCWAHPAFANRCVFVRNDKELICASLAAESEK